LIEILQQLLEEMLLWVILSLFYFMGYSCHFCHRIDV